jgi:hypothetical protein
MALARFLGSGSTFPDAEQAREVRDKPIGFAFLSRNVGGGASQHTEQRTRDACFSIFLKALLTISQ